MPKAQQNMQVHITKDFYNKSYIAQCLELSSEVRYDNKCERFENLGHENISLMKKSFLNKTYPPISLKTDFF